MVEHEDIEIISTELLPLSETGGLDIWLEIHMTHITTPYSVDSSFETAGYETETEVEIEIGEVYDADGERLQIKDEQIKSKQWWKQLEQKATEYAEQY